MPKTKLNPDEIEQHILTRIRSFDVCRNVQGIIIKRVSRSDAEANWEIDGYVVDGGPLISHDCKVHAIATQRRLQRDFDAIWPEDRHPADSEDS